MEKLNQLLLQAIKDNNVDGAEALVFQGANPSYVLQETCRRLHADKRSEEKSLKLKVFYDDNHAPAIELDPSQISFLLRLPIRDGTQFKRK